MFDITHVSKNILNVVNPLASEYISNMHLSDNEVDISRSLITIY